MPTLILSILSSGLFDVICLVGSRHGSGARRTFTVLLPGSSRVGETVSVLTDQLRVLKQAAKVQRIIQLVKISCSNLLWSVRVL